MNVRIVVADERAASFFDMQGALAPVVSTGTLINPASTLKDSELETDRPGRRANFNRTEGPGAGRHAVDGERSTREHEMEQFARDVARTVDDARVRNEFDRLVIVAGPRMLGRIREFLPSACRPLVAAEVPKHLVHDDTDAIRDSVPRDAFFH